MNTQTSDQSPFLRIICPLCRHEFDVAPGVVSTCPRCDSAPPKMEINPNLRGCPTCGRAISAHADSCPGCGHAFTERTGAQVSRTIAGVASFFIPGLGQLILGRILPALAFLITSCALWLVGIGWIIHIVAAFDAGRRQA